MQHIAEADLIASSREGNQEAIAELFRRYYPSSLHLAHGILRQPEDAQDAVQSAYFLAFRRLDNFRGDSSFKTWVTRIVMNCCLLHLRDAKRRGTWVPLEDAHAGHATHRITAKTPTPEKSTWCREIASAFSAAVARLPKEQRDTYTLFTVSELSLQEVATELGLTIPATKTRLFRARAGLRSSLTPVWAGRQIRDMAS